MVLLGRSKVVGAELPRSSRYGRIRRRFLCQRSGDGRQRPERCRVGHTPVAQKADRAAVGISVMCWSQLSVVERFGGTKACQRSARPV